MQYEYGWNALTQRPHGKVMESIFGSVALRKHRSKEARKKVRKQVSTIAANFLAGPFFRGPELLILTAVTVTAVYCQELTFVSFTSFKTPSIPGGKGILCGDFTKVLPLSLPLYSREFNLHCCYRLVTAKFSRDVICNDCSWDETRESKAKQKTSLPVQLGSSSCLVVLLTSKLSKTSAI